jgi:predicted dehydrogenase
MISILMTNAVAHLIRGESTEVTHGIPYLRPNSATYSDEKISGGGHIYAQTSHLGAYLTFITGEPPVEVFARFHNDGGSLDIFNVINVQLRSGCIASIATTGLTPADRRNHEVRIFGTKGILFLELWHGKMKLLRFDGETEVFPPLEEDEIYPSHAPAQNLIDCVLNPHLNQSPGTLGAAAMELIEAACISARSGRNVLVESLGLLGNPVINV